MKKNLLKQGLALLLTLCCVLTLIPAMTVETTAAELEGDVWDGSITHPTTIVPKNGINYYEITKCSELAYVAQTGGDWLTYNYILGNNLILNEVEFTWDEDGNLTNPQAEIDALHQWTPIDSFKGIFDGNGYVISGLYVNSPKFNDIGLFGYTGIANNGGIINTTVKNAYLVGDSYTGGIVGYNNLKIQDCSFSGFVMGTSSVGGIAGETFSSITNSCNYGTIIGKGTVVGGIAGGSGGSITNSCNYGTIIGKGTAVGGITGYSSDSVHGSYNFGNVNGTERVGGIVGSYSRSSVSSRYNVSDVYNFAHIEGTSSVGGIIGSAEYLKLKNAYNLGSISAQTNAGAIIGNSDHIWGDRSTITNCYYAKTPDLYAFGNRTDTGIADDEPGIAEPKTLAELKQRSTFVNWDFDTVWAIDPTLNDGYPYLRWQTFSDTPIEINSITLDQTTLTLSVGDTAYLAATVSPATATDKTLTWTTSAPSVATVTPAGKVTAVAPGTATITAASADGNHSASCTVTVEPRTADEYTLTALTVRDASGNPHTTVPATSFWTTVTVRNNTSSGDSTVLLASYDTNGQYLGLYAAQMEEIPAGASVKLSFFIPNTDGKVAQLKAFCVASLENLMPLSTTLTVGSQK